jgi:hypothetical protein
MAEQQTRRDFEARIVAKAWKDDAFRQQLVSDPKGTLAREMGIEKLPDNITVRVIEESPTEYVLILPPHPREKGAGELSDADLAEVAGGGFVTPPFTSACQKGV